MNPSINFVYFDIGGVFFNWRDFFYNDLPIFLDRKPEAVMSLIQRYDNSLFRGEITVPEFWETLMVELKVSPEVGELVFEKRFENFYPYEISQQFAQTVANKYPIGLLSNLYLGDYEEFCKNGFIPNLEWNSVIISCQVGLIKPELAIYELATNHISLPRESILFIDDLAKNTAAAKEYGWQTYTFDENNLEKSISELKTLLF